MAGYRVPAIHSVAVTERVNADRAFHNVATPPGPTNLTGAITMPKPVIAGSLTGPGASGFSSLSAMTLTDVTWTGTGIGTLDTTRINSTFNNIGVELRYTGDPDDNSTVTMDYKTTAGSIWRTVLPFYRSIGAPADKYHTGSALLCTPGTSYDLRLNIIDGTDTAQVTATVSTRTDINVTTALTPNRWLDSVAGNDANTGTTSGTPVKSLRKAVQLANAAASAQVWLVKDGSYVATSALGINNASDIPITFVAEHPAAGRVSTSIGGQTRSLATLTGVAHPIIEPRASDGGPLVWGPTAAADSDLQSGATTDTGTITSNRKGPWTNPSITGTDSVVYTDIWKWTACPAEASTTPARIVFASTRTGLCTSLAFWRPVVSGSLNVAGSEPPWTWGDLTTVQGWVAEMHRTPGLYNYGCWNDGTTNDLYLRLPGDVNPNTLYGWVSPEEHFTLPSGQAILPESADQRYSGLEFRGNTIGVATFGTQPCPRLIIDRCFFNNTLSAVHETGTAGPPSVYNFDLLFDSNFLQAYFTWEDGTLRNAVTANGPYPVPWRFVKGTPGKGNEGGGMGANGSSRRRVVRFNRFDSTFDAVGTFDTGFDRYSGSDNDFHDNYIVHCSDDMCDLSFNKNNLRVYNNRCELTRDGFSYGPIASGIVYVFNNVWWRVGMSGLVSDWIGTTTSGTGFMLKMEGWVPWSKTYWLNNTWWSDITTDARGHATQDHLWSLAAGGSGPDSGRITYRNSIGRGQGGASSSIITQIQNPPSHNGYFVWDSDYNDWSAVPGSAAGNANGYVQNFPGVDPGNSTSAYRTNAATFGVGTHDCLRSTTFSGVCDAELVNPTAGDLRLKTTSVLVNAGTPIYPFERAGTDYLGAAPDLGYIEVA